MNRLLKAMKFVFYLRELHMTQISLKEFTWYILFLYVKKWLELKLI